MKSKPIELACFYTSGLKPLNHETILPPHDDWGIKFLHSSEYIPLAEWKKMCENIYMEAKAFLKEENDGVFVRSWSNNTDKFITFAVEDRENKGAMRRNVLIAIFFIKAEMSLQKLVSQITFAGESLPNGLKEIKKDPNVDIGIATEQEVPYSIMLKLGIPIEMEKDINKTTTTYMPVPKNRRKSFVPWVITLIMAVVATISFITKQQVTFVTENMSASFQPQLFQNQERLLSLEKECVDLQQKITLSNNKLRDKTYELSEKDSIIAELGGWESLKVMINISKKYQIDRAEKLQLVLERLKKDLEESQKKENVTEQKLIVAKDIVYNQKKDIEDILERLEEEIVKENNEVILTSGTWKSIQKKLKTIIESE